MKVLLAAIGVFLVFDDFKDAAAALTVAMAKRDYEGIEKSLAAFPEKDARTFKFLTDKVPSADWWTKGRIVDAWVRQGDAKSLIAEVQGGKRKDVREACTIALGRLEGEGVVAALEKALSDPEWRIRRAGVISLGTKVSRERIDALIGRLADEKETAVRTLILARLASWTGRPYATSDWAAWWKARREEPLDEAAANQGEVEFQGYNLKHETVVLPDSKIGIVVIPGFLTKSDHFRPYFDFLSSYASVHYLRLPDHKDLMGADRVYPVDALVGAIEKMREGFKEEKLIFVGHGAGAWLAMVYASRHKNSVIGIFALGAWVDEDSYVAGLKRAIDEAKRKRDTYLEEAVSSLVSTSDTKSVKWRKGHRLAFQGEKTADPTDLYHSLVYDRLIEDYEGGASVPDMKTLLAGGLPTPVHFVFGAHDAFSGLPEFGKGRKYLPNSTCTTFDQSGEFPHLTEADKFEKTMADFLNRILKKK